MIYDFRPGERTEGGDRRWERPQTWSQETNFAFAACGVAVIEPIIPTLLAHSVRRHFG